MPMTLSEFNTTSHSAWFALPEDSRRIQIQFYGGMDTNYRALMFESNDFELGMFLDSCIEKNAQYSGQVINRRHDHRFSLSGLFQAFRYGSEFIPDWWIMFANHETSRASFAYWTSNRYGMGYLVVSGFGSNITVLQFSQQHLELDSLLEAFPAN